METRIPQDKASKAVTVLCGDDQVWGQVAGGHHQTGDVIVVGFH